MKRRFIIDKNIDCRPRDARYPDYFMNDLKGKNTIAVVFGGTEYKAEVRDKAALRDLILEMASAGKLESVNDELVDAHQTILSQRILSKLGKIPNECDDLHLLALSHVSGCLNIISRDDRMAKCRDKIRAAVGHDYCPAIKVVHSETTYNNCT